MISVCKFKLHYSNFHAYTLCMFEPKQDISKFVKLGNRRIFDDPISKRLSMEIRQKIVGFDRTLSEYLTNMEIITFLIEQIQNDTRQING